MTTTPAQTMTPPRAISVVETLVSLHDRWFQQVHEHLEPLLATDADIWGRWSAVRFLSDQFDDWFDHERELVRSLAHHIRASGARRLEQSAADLASLCRELDKLGRRKVDGETRAVARRFFARLQLWRVEVEAELAGISCDQLVDDDLRLLHRLEVLAGQNR